MGNEASRAGTPERDHDAVRALYAQLLDRWNERDAPGYAALFHEEGHVVGFDGSEMHGPAEIEATIGKIFADHMTALYVGKVRDVRRLTPGVALLRAVVGMTPREQAQLNPAANAVQSVLATEQGGQWRVAFFQNTPAQYHGRPELAEALTEELQALL
ncbi:MAG TPA: SgcJ/EcaC family oxidoreductase [Candidatus Sulfomarinibacteraceae bacterium]|nr:SgcJ/EcaC family oxidoreductase [Candidatus Sulfomarinibacteraceae bacterium]